MKTGIILIILGIIIGAAGAISMVGSASLADLWGPSAPMYSSTGGVIEAFGLGAVIVGGGLGLVGLIKIGLYAWREHY